MGTIIARKRKDGSTAHLAQVLIKKAGLIVRREARTFDRRQAAAAWLERREKELAAPGALDQQDPVLSDVIDRYVAESKKKIGRTKAQVLNAIKRYDIASLRCSKIASTDLVAFANELVKRVQPQTVSNYLSHLASIFAIARPAWGYPLDQDAMKDAFVVAKRLGVTSKSRSRDRRPTVDELDLLMTHFGERQKRRPSSVPMQKVIAFAMFSTRRLEEITRLRRTDLDEDGSRILVRDMKNPGEKIGNDVWCDLPAVALQIIASMPSDAEEIFPFTTDAIGAGFTRACQILGINNLHFHDLRHEGVSRLFEMGRNIPQVAAVSGHRSWSSLKRYTHLRQTGDKYANWKWLSVVSNQAQPNVMG
ncbi:tyrosine-type recombinase/integrase [Bradyrhizobium sp. Gha]|uniref:tyrosine-type recombinase/integrase n=1 Tax=Bradyrhizobium sp. Gha TaxID=1855318 RepID=UPI0008E1B27D|nr:tyrosine-type recombinase/integrase [Bradyrhizobium sp. Gha]SFH64518.1 Phage integrase family protein [Bradyrhizobium sp. Gha]